MRKLPRRYLLIPIVYVGFVVALLCLALFGRGFSHEVDGLRLSGMYTAWPPFSSKNIRSLSLSYEGLRLDFSPRIALETAQGPARLSALESYSSGADIIFENNYRLRLATLPGEEDAFSLSLVSPTGSGDSLSLSIPFALGGAAREPSDTPVLAWKRGAQQFAFSLTASSRVDAEAGAIELVAESGSAQGMRLGSTGTSAADSYSALLSSQAAGVSAEDFRRAVLQFLDAAYKGWSDSRLAGATDLRQIEEIGAAFIAESIPREDYQRVRNLYAAALARRIQSQPGDQYLHSSSAFIGNLRAYFRAQEASESSRIEAARGLLSNSDASIFSRSEDLIPYLLDHGPFSLVEDLFGFMKARDPSQLETSSALGLAEALLDYADLLGQKDTCIAQCRRLIEERILPSVKSAGGVLFLQGQTPGEVDLTDSIRSGALLIRASDAIGNESLAVIGRSLIVSSLRLMDDSAILPETIAISSGGVSSRAGTLAPEALYRYVATGRMFPRERPLYSHIGPGAWIWTAASIQAAEGTETGLRIVLSFPTGLTHYVLVQGIRPFSAIQLHGIPWRTDPGYAQYSDGWYYEDQTGTFYLKLTHRQEEEEILVSY